MGRAEGDEGPTVVVIGSLNLDMVVPVPHHPRPGETVLGGDHRSTPGGKGANQAVAAARLGRAVALVGRVGDDDAGRTLRAALESENVDVAHTRATSDAPSGIAMISVDGSGENAIVVSPGANGRLTPADVEAAGEVIERADVVLCQLEVPVESVTAGARCARGTVMLNPAPARPLPADLLESVDVLVPNRGELAMLTNASDPPDHDGVAELAGRIAGPSVVVVTLGADGALLLETGNATHVRGPDVAVVDTVGAGDAFCGALADAMVRGASNLEGVRWAVAAGALATTKEGAQTAMPRAAEVERVLR
jgi:ribokinase